MASTRAARCAGVMSPKPTVVKVTKLKYTASLKVNEAEDGGWVTNDPGMKVLDEVVGGRPAQAQEKIDDDRPPHAMGRHASGAQNPP